MSHSIFIKSYLNYKTFGDVIKLLIDLEEFFCKIRINNLKLQIKTPDSFRKVTKLLKENEVEFYTYQIKQEKPYRVVLPNLFHITLNNLTIQELSDNGFIARQVVNVINKITKLQLPLFFIDLEPDQNSKDIFKLNLMCYTKIKVKEPYPRRQLIQCLRC